MCVNRSLGATFLGARSDYNLIPSCYCDWTNINLTFFSHWICAFSSWWESKVLSDDIKTNSLRGQCQIIKHVNRVLSFCVFLNVSCSLQWRDQTEGEGWGGLGWCIPVINANWQWTPALQQKVAPSETSIWWPHTSRQTASSSVMAAPPWEGCQLRRLTHIGPGFPLMSGFSYSNPLLSLDCLLNHKSQADLWHSYTPEGILWLYMLFLKGKNTNHGPDLRLTQI